MSVSEMIMESVSSSTIESYGWKPKKESTGTMYIKFKNGTLYRYSAVPTKILKGFVSAKSKGKYFASNIRYKFTTTKV